eukprot:107794-Rhodomonas_salina.3
MRGTDLAYAAMLPAYAPATQCPVAIMLRRCYAMSGTGILYAASGSRACYAMSGTEIAYGAVGLLDVRSGDDHSLPVSSASMLRACYAMSGTEIA